MSKDQVYGWVILLLSLGIIGGYLWVVFLPPLAGLDILVLKLTGAAAIVFGFAIVAWIGYTLATTPPPEPFDVSELHEKEDKSSESQDS